MVKKIRSLVAIVLAAALVAVPVFADDTTASVTVSAEEKAAFEGGTYSFFGDSIATGYSYSHGATYGYNDYSEVTWSYPAQVAAALGMTEDFNSHAVIAARSTEILTMLGLNTRDTTETYYTFWNDDLQSEYGLSWDLQSVSYTELANADLITINIGSNDVLTQSLVNASTSTLDSAGLLETYSANLTAITGTTDFLTQLESVMATMNEAGEAANFVAALCTAMVTNEATWQTNMATIMTTLRAAAPNAVIAVVGMYNPYRNLTTEGDYALQIGQTLTPLITLMNSWMSTNASTYGYTYVDVTETECFSTTGTNTINLDNIDTSSMASLILSENYDPHPTDEGDIYMAQQIVNAIEGQTPVTPVTPDEPDAPDVPDTGDFNNGYLMVILLGAAAALVGVVVYDRKRKAA